MTIERIAFLGDSLSDQDEFWSYSTRLVDPPFPRPPFYDQKFTNGLIHAQVLPVLLGLGGGDATNYAVASAQALAPRTVADVVGDELASGDFELRDDADLGLLDDRIDLAAQTDRLLQDAATDGSDLSDLAVVTWIGVNDLNNWEPEDFRFWRWRDDLEDLVSDIADATIASTAALLAAGVGEVWVATQPELSFYPAFAEASPIIEFFSAGLIEQLNDELIAGVEALGDPRAQILDINLLADEIETDPANFRVDIDDPILLSFGSDPDPTLNPDLPADFDFASDADEYGFLDFLHPTETLHGIIAAFEAEAIASTLLSGDEAPDVLAATIGDDLVLASGGSDLVALRAGDDVALGGRGDDLIWGMSGADLISGGAGDDTLLGGPGDDLLTGGAGDDLALGGSGRDLLIDTAGSDLLGGGDGGDFFFWIESGDSLDMDTVQGGEGDDHLTLFLESTASFDAAMAAFEAGATDQTFAGLDVSGVESFAFFDLSASPQPELPDLTDTLAARLVEWDLWNFA